MADLENSKGGQRGQIIRRGLATPINFTNVNILINN